MTIKTLEFIHRLLLEKEAETKRNYERARRPHQRYEENEAASKDLIERQKAAANEHMAALNALEGFESHDW